MKVVILSVVLLFASLQSAVAAMIEETLQAPGPQGPLVGTLLTPGGAAPVVLILPGSGPTDRDGNNPLGVRAASYRLLAEGLAEQGIASLRIDKRGLFASAGALDDANAVTLADYADDVLAWTAVLTRRGSSCVWLAGHSEGGLLALAAAQHDADICGLILIAAPGRPIGEVLRDQFNAGTANPLLLAQAEPLIADLEAGIRVDVRGNNKTLRNLFHPRHQGFLISLFSYDPVALLATYAGPVLVVQGTSDLQVSLVDAERLANARPGVELAVLPDVNHVLKQAPADDRAANLAAYADPDLPLAQGVAASIADFVKSHSP